MRYVLGVMLTAAVGMMTGDTTAHAASIAGSWSGSGVVQLKTGHKERVRCRVSYSKSTGRTFGLSATCASTAGTISQSGRVVQLKGGNRYTGRLYNPQHAVSGKILVSVKGSSQTVTVTSSQGRGQFTLRKR